MTEHSATSSPAGRRHVRHDQIAQRARELWEAYGHPVGRDEQIWLQAERELRGLDLRNGRGRHPAIPQSGTDGSRR